MIKLSIIIPHYNSVSSLIKLLNSIPHLEWIEIIVIDDNSDEDIFNLKSNYKNVFFYKLDNNRKGAGAARNVGIHYSIGEFLLFADADDYFLKGAFDIIRTYLDSENDIVFFNPTSLNLLTNKIGIRHNKYAIIIQKYLTFKNKEILYKFHVPWSKLISSKFIKDKKIRFEEIISSNDVNFSLKSIFYANRITCTLDQIYCVTESSNSLTNTFTEEVLDSRFDAACRYNDFLQIKGFKNLQTAMSGHLWNTRFFGFYKFLYRFFYCKYKKYPFFYDFKHLLSVFRHYKN
jgi:glycosyltransferase involved in cell wall biosynthesis